MDGHFEFCRHAGCSLWRLRKSGYADYVPDHGLSGLVRLAREVLVIAAHAGRVIEPGGVHGGHDTGTYTIGAGGDGSGAGDGSSVSGTRGNNGPANRGHGGSGGTTSDTSSGNYIGREGIAGCVVIYLG